MTFAAAIFLLAVGAILRYATNLHVEGVNVDTVGLILMIAGAVGLVIAFFQETVWSRRRRAVVAEREIVAPPQEVRDPRQPPRY
jgi:cytochrome c oxidase subunit IV